MELYCPNCNNKINDQMKYCSECGRAITHEDKQPIENKIEEGSEVGILGRAGRVVLFISIVIVGFLFISGVIGISKKIFGSEEIVALFYPLLGKNATVYLASFIGILRYGIPFYLYYRLVKYCRNKLVPMK